MDALDECTEDERRVLVNLLINIHHSLPKGRCVKVFFTSRPTDDLSRMLRHPSIPVFIYQISPADTANDIKPFIDEEVAKFSGYFLDGKASPEIKQHVVDQLNEKADGMCVPYPLKFLDGIAY